MLILARQIGETIMIGTQVTVTVLEVNGRKVRLGIDAPSTVLVHRKEIFDRINQEKSKLP